MKFSRATVVGLVIGASLGLAGAAFPAEKAIQCQWAAAPVRVDGASQDWQDAVLLMDKGSKAEYALRNDGEFLYILFLFKSPASLSTYEVSGMKVYYSLAGKKAKGTGFHFVKRSLSADELIANIEKGGEALTEEKKAEIRKQKGYMTYVGVPVEVCKKVPGQAAVEPDDRRPSATSSRLGLSVVPSSGVPWPGSSRPANGGRPGTALKLGFEWGGMTAEMRSAYMARAAVRSTGRRRRRPRFPGEQRLRGGKAAWAGPWAASDPRTRKHAFWIDVKLAARGE